MIYRKFGQSTQNIFLQRNIQDIVYNSLSVYGLGPCIYYNLNGIRIEQFIPSRIIKTSQMLNPNYYQKVAFTLRRFHDLKIDKIPKNNYFDTCFLQNKETILNSCYKKMQKNIFNQKQLQIIKQLRNWVNINQLELLKKLVISLQQDSVFSHNDLLAGNILIKDDDQNVMFIDYEYSRYNYRIFDIANYFNQSYYDYQVKQYPYFAFIESNTQKEFHKKRFIQCYSMAQQNNFIKYLNDVKQNKMSQNARIMSQKLKKQLNLGLMLSNAMWGWWAIIVSKNPLISFGYIQFSAMRLREYNKIKSSILL